MNPGWELCSVVVFLISPSQPMPASGRQAETIQNVGNRISRPVSVTSRTEWGQLSEKGLTFLQEDEGDSRILALTSPACARDGIVKRQAARSRLPPVTDLREISAKHESGRIMKNSTSTTRALSAQFVFLLLFSAAIFDFQQPASAQSLVSNDVKHDTEGHPIKRDQGVHVDVNLALVNVTVTDPYNRLVTGLEPDNFRIFEDNIEQEVVNFSSEDVPISIGVILDLSGSMANKLGKAKEAALQFFQNRQSTR